MLRKFKVYGTFPVSVMKEIEVEDRDEDGELLDKGDLEALAIEKAYDERLKGKQGLKIIERDAFGKVKSESIVRKAVDGENLNLSIDSDIETKLFNSIKDLADRVGFAGGGGAIMDVKTGEIGGLIEKESNLSHNDDAWVSGNAKVFGSAEVFGSAKI